MQVDTPLETLPFSATFLALMIPMTATIAHQTRARNSRAVTEFRKLTFIVASLSCVSAGLDVVARSPFVARVTNGCITDVTNLHVIVYFIFSAQFFDVFNCTVNFFIYMTLSREFRHTFAGCFSFRRREREEESESGDRNLSITVISLTSLPDV